MIKSPLLKNYDEYVEFREDVEIIFQVRFPGYKVQSIIICPCFPCIAVAAVDILSAILKAVVVYVFVYPGEFTSEINR